MSVIDTVEEAYSGPYGIIPVGEEERFQLDKLELPWLDTCIEILNDLYDGIPVDLTRNGEVMCLTGSDELDFSVRSILRVDRTRPSTKELQHDEATSLIVPTSPDDDRIFGEFHKFHRRVVEISSESVTKTDLVLPLGNAHVKLLARIVDQ